METNQKSILTSEQEKELRFIKNYLSWPMWPYLPVKKRREDGLFQICGLMKCDTLETPPNPIIYKEDFYTLVHNAKEKKEITLTILKEFNSLEEVVQDGWVVD